MTDVLSPNERWVVGYEGKYSVTDDGKVFSHVGSKKELNIATGSGGYQVVSLRKNNKTQFGYVHKLMAEAFIPNPYGATRVKFRDENRLNLHIINLYWDV